MYTRVKTNQEIETMRTGGQILAKVLSALTPLVKPGISTKKLNELAAGEIKSRGAEAAFLGYQGFPMSICISVNDEVVHGIPRDDKIINGGDIVSLDLGIRYKGMITDGAVSVVCGRGTKQTQELLKYTEQSLYEALAVIKSGCHAGDIGFAVQKVLDKQRYGIVRDLVGHGVGHDVHEDPNIPNYGCKNTGPKLAAGMTLAIEPMATLGGDGVVLDPDGWTVRTRDGSWSAHFEHTVLITDEACEILTLADSTP